MSLSTLKSKEKNLFGADNVLRDFLPEDDPMMVFKEKIVPEFKDDEFLDCYSKKGRNAKSPALLSSITLLQFRENLSDMEAINALERRLDWKIALGLSIEEKSILDASTLCRFRKRLLVHDKENYIFDKILSLCQKHGFVEKRTKQRIDATHIVKHVNRISTTDLLHRSLTALMRVIKKYNSELYEDLPEHIHERYSKPHSSFGLSKSKRADKQAEIIEDGYLLESLLNDQEKISPEISAQLEIMKTIFSENVVIREKEVNEKTFIEVEEIKKPKQSIFDPEDTSLKLGAKGKTTRVGSKCHVMETAEKGRINFITGMIQQEAQASDQKIHDEVKASNESHDLEPEEMYTDQNYISGESIKQYRESDQELLGYIQLDNSKRDPEYKTENFKIDFDKKTAVCPEGKESRPFKQREGSNSEIHFDRQDCQSCSAFKKCVNERADGKRVLSISPYYHEIYERRETQNKPEFKKKMKVRAQVEGTISELVRFHGLRKIKYKYEKGRQLQYLLSGTALNVKRFIRALNYGLELHPAPS